MNTDTRRDTQLIQQGDLLIDDTGEERYISVRAAQQLIESNKRKQAPTINMTYLVVLLAAVAVIGLILPPRQSQPPQVVIVPSQQGTGAEQGAYLMASNQARVDDLRLQLTQKENELAKMRDEASRSTAQTAQDQAHISQLEGDVASLRQQVATLQVELTEANKGGLQRIGEAIFGK